ncbi:unnamed protein product [Miscanthus lutarioriparius]|uniref:Uncharacterized protein n=1 Tax=Miscanthus lutarioriparius TaxID=422564 RepID=A0A811NCE0_9POAL|nr:unnamed protein product [Miscanthus lutarioriparius]
MAVTDALATAWQCRFVAMSADCFPDGNFSFFTASQITKSKSNFVEAVEVIDAKIKTKFLSYNIVSRWNLDFKYFKLWHRSSFKYESHPIITYEAEGIQTFKSLSGPKPILGARIFPPLSFGAVFQVHGKRAENRDISKDIKAILSHSFNSEA